MKTKYLLILAFSLNASHVHAAKPKLQEPSGHRSVHAARTLERPNLPRSGSKPDAGLRGQNSAAMRQGFAAAKDLRGMNQVRNATPGTKGGAYGIGPKPQEKTSAPDLSLNGDRNSSSRTVGNPLDRSRDDGRGFTDLRGSSNRSRQGQQQDGGKDGRDPEHGNNVSPPADRHGNNTPSSGSEFVSTSRDTVGNSGSTTHTTTWHDKDTGEVIGQTVERKSPDGTLTRDGYEANGDRIFHEVTPPSRRHTDRNPEGSSTGGPVNGNGPSVLASSGLQSIDLLRQLAEGGNSNGGNQMTSGKISSSHVRPGDPNSPTSNGGPVRNRVAANRFGTISNPGTVTGGSATGGDRPD